MADDRRKRSRVQGGWASSGSGSKNGPRSDQNKPPVAVCPAWIGKTVDQPSLQRKFVYEPTEEPVKQKLPDKVITKAGVYDLSEGPEGVSRIRYFPDFLEELEANEIYNELYNELPWKQEVNMKYNAVEPRLTVWFGDLPYKYSGVLQKANTEWPPILRDMKNRLEEVTGYQFNSVLGNLYRDGHDSIDWHADDEASLGPSPTIASLSFGDTRNFEMRKKPHDGKDYDLTPHMKIPLTHGSLLIMEGATQEDWHHRVPKEYHDRGPRINLTYRVILPE